MKTFYLLIITLLLSACATSQRSSTESVVSSNTSLSDYQSYSWLGKPPSSAPLRPQRIVQDIDTQLRSKGWVVADDADVAIVARITTRRRVSSHSADSHGSGHRNLSTSSTYGGSSAHAGLRNFSTGNVNSAMPPMPTMDMKTVGILSIELLDPKTDQIVWRGQTEISIPESSGKLNATIDAGISELFAKFPAVANSSASNPG